eukprot:TRINITY_DN2055_c1_g1_i1.p1 TRINITY_DN2055_c1_g1~~TRINITY_DN2055_c1_g1_i1.p1  ORF type:complete len:1894 (-),score=539.26 TRINITY_DN2055_c1_g1_i1:157-5838(-)
MLSFSSPTLRRLFAIVRDLSPSNGKELLEEAYELMKLYGVDGRPFFLGCLLDIAYKGSPNQFQVKTTKAQLTDLITRPNFITLICQAFELVARLQSSGSEFHLTENYIGGICKKCDFSLRQFVSVGVAMSFFSEPAVAKEGRKFLKSSLTAYCKSDVHEKLPINVLHSFNQFVHTQEISGDKIWKENLAILVKIHQPSTKSFVTKPVLQAMDPTEQITHDAPTVSITDLDDAAHFSLASLLKDVGPVATVSEEVFRATMTALDIPQKLDETQMAEIITMCVIHNTSTVKPISDTELSLQVDLLETLLGEQSTTSASSSEASSSATSPMSNSQFPALTSQNRNNNKNNNNDSANAGLLGIENKVKIPRDSLPSFWNLEVIAQVWLKDFSDLNFGQIILKLDKPVCLIDSLPRLEQFLGFLSLCGCEQESTQKLLEEWKNAETHLRLLMLALSAPQGVVSFHMCGPFLDDFIRRHPNGPQFRNLPWVSLPLVDALMRLSDGPQNTKVKKILNWPMSNCPELLLLGVAHQSFPSNYVSLPGQELRNELLEFIPKLSHDAFIHVFVELWNLDPQKSLMVLQSMFVKDQNKVSWIIEVTEIIPEVVEAIIEYPCNLSMVFYLGYYAGAYTVLGNQLEQLFSAKGIQDDPERPEFAALCLRSMMELYQNPNTTRPPQRFLTAMYRVINNYRQKWKYVNQQVWSGIDALVGFGPQQSNLPTMMDSGISDVSLAGFVDEDMEQSIRQASHDLEQVRIAPTPKMVPPVPVPGSPKLRGNDFTRSMNARFLEFSKHSPLDPNTTLPIPPEEIREKVETLLKDIQPVKSEDDETNDDMTELASVARQIHSLLAHDAVSAVFPEIDVDSEERLSPIHGSEQHRLTLPQKHMFNWLCAYIVEKMIKTDDKLHEGIMALFSELKVDFIEKQTYHLAITHVWLILKDREDDKKKSKQISNTLGCLGEWIGRNTLALDKPILRIDLDLKELVFYCFDNQLITKCGKVLRGILQFGDRSTVFKLPNPWVLSILKLCKEIVTREGEKLSQIYDIVMIFRHYAVVMEEVESSSILASRHSLRRQASAKPFTPARIQTPKPVVSVPTPPSRSTLPSPSLTPIIPCVPQVPNLERYIKIDENLELFGQYSGLKPYIVLAVDQTIQYDLDNLLPNVTSNACVTTMELIKKDFDKDPDETRIILSARPLVRDLAGSLAIASKPNVRSFLASTLTSLFQQHFNNTNTPENLQSMIQTAVERIVDDNLSLCVAFVCTDAIGKATKEMDVLIRQYTSQRVTPVASTPPHDLTPYLAHQSYLNSVIEELKVNLVCVPNMFPEQQQQQQPQQVSRPPSVAPTPKEASPLSITEGIPLRHINLPASDPNVKVMDLYKTYVNMISSPDAHVYFPEYRRLLIERQIYGKNCEVALQTIASIVLDKVLKEKPCDANSFLDIKNTPILDYGYLADFVRFINFLVMSAPRDVEHKHLFSVLFDRVHSVFVKCYEIAERDNRVFDQRPFVKLLCMLINSINNLKCVNQQTKVEIFHNFSRLLISLRPQKYPSFLFGWMHLLSHHKFMPHLLLTTKRIWVVFHDMFMVLLAYLQPFLVARAKTPLGEEPHGLLQIIYEGLLRILVMLFHDVPDFLYGFHSSFCDVIPSKCIQLRNIVLSAKSRASHFDGQTRPVVMTNYVLPLERSGLRQLIDNFLETGQPKDFYQRVHEKLFLPIIKENDDGTVVRDLRVGCGVDPSFSIEPELVVHDDTYDVPLINAVVLYFVSHGSLGALLKIFKNLCLCLPVAARHYVLSAMINQLRLNERHTVYVYKVLSALFNDLSNEVEEHIADTMKEHITRVFMDRLIFGHPHPWGLWGSFRDLLRHNDFLALKFVQDDESAKHMFANFKRPSKSGAPSKSTRSDESKHLE